MNQRCWLSRWGCQKQTKARMWANAQRDGRPAKYSIPKGKGLNTTDSANYRGIALNPIYGKLFDLVVVA